MKPTFAIVGANLAGGRAAEALRAAGFDGRILLIGAEPHAPYERPPLSKEILKGALGADDLFIRAPAAFEDDEIELVLGTRVLRLLASSRGLELDGGQSVRADKVLLCTGGTVRRLHVPGAGLPGVVYLRTLDDALALRERLKAQARVVVVGAGFVGSEVAACAREAGCEVTMLELAPVPLSRVLPREIGAAYAQLHRDHGVRLLTGVGVERIVGDVTVRQVILTDGSVIDADVVVVGVGVDPATELAEGSGIHVDNGIVVNEFCETSVTGVYSAGDVASHPNPILGERLRLEHYQNAQNQAVAAARSMVGQRTPFAEVPWFWSDQYDVNLQVAGHPKVTDEVVIRGDVDALSCCAFYLRGGALKGAIALNAGKDVRAAMKLIEHRTPVDAASLRDPSTDLRKLRR